MRAVFHQCTQPRVASPASSTVRHGPWAGLRPWRTDIFKVSGDPDFEAKLDDVIGLYLDPPERAVVFNFDEKTQIQALDRTQPSLPLKAGRARTMTHDYKRNGTTDLFAALDVATGQVLTQTRRRHTGNDVLAFFKEIGKSTPRHLDSAAFSKDAPRSNTACPPERALRLRWPCCGTGAATSPHRPAERLRDALRGSRVP